MIAWRRCLPLAVLALWPALTVAQTGTPAAAATTTAREQAQARREALQARRELLRSLTPEQRQALRERVPARRAGGQAASGIRMPVESPYRRDLSAYRSVLRERARVLRALVDAGTITRDSMATELQAFRRANRPVRARDADGRRLR